MKTLEVTTISDIRLQTNRQNSLSSTGPVTVAGKQKSRWNALRHGLLAKEVVIPVGDLPESKQEFSKLLKSLQIDLSPIGTVEEMLVERIAISYWRLSRCVRAETGEIGKASTGKTHEFYRSMTEEVETIRDRIYDEHKFSSYRKSSFGLMHVIKHLEQLKDKLELTKDLDDDEFVKLTSIYGKNQNSLPFTLKLVAFIGKEQASKAHAESNNGKRPKKDRSLKFMLELIADEIGRCQKHLEQISEIEDDRLHSKIRSASIPPSETIEKLLRYESAIERQLYKALDQLERLQRRRKGEFVPPPAQLGVTLET